MWENKLPLHPELSKETQATKIHKISIIIFGLKAG
jgi:hypothetical protein